MKTIRDVILPIVPDRDDFKIITRWRSDLLRQLQGLRADVYDDLAEFTPLSHSHANLAQLDLVTDGDHDVRVDNPHGVTKTQVGLGSVPNIDFTSLTNDSMVDSWHRHSELSASDGTPNPALQVNADGKVGIGIASPAYNLHIIDPNSNYVVLTMGSATYQTSCSVFQLVSDTGTGQIWKAGSGYSAYGGVGALNIYNSENLPITFYQDVNERMRIAADGKVGIGTTAPKQPHGLHLDYSGSGGPGFITSQDGMYIGNNFYYNRVWRYIAADEASMIGFGNGNIYFYTAPTGTADDIFTWTNTGYIDTSGNLQLNGYLIATKGQKPINNNYGNITENTLFDNLSPHIPITNDTILVHGAIMKAAVLYIISYAFRYNSTTIYLYYLNSSGGLGYYPIVDGDTDTFGCNLAW